MDDLATAYPGTPSAVLLVRVRGYLGHVTRLLDAKTTLAEHRRLLVVGGWLSLLAATTLIDLHRDHVAAAHLRTAARLARVTEHAEIAAWCLETQAWQVLTAGDYRRAADISQAAQRIAPKSGSAFIQATAQEGRAWARLGDARQTRATLNRVEALVSPLPVPDRPEHHYRYDPPKAQFYVATTLSWLGDTAAEGIARQVLAAIEAPELRPRPRRAALARLDLALALTAADKHDRGRRSGRWKRSASVGCTTVERQRRRTRSSSLSPSAACPKPPSWLKRGRRHCDEPRPSRPALTFAQTDVRTRADEFVPSWLVDLGTG